MGKMYINVNGKVARDTSKDYEGVNICAANGTYCLPDCKYEETKSCKRHEIKKAEYGINTIEDGKKV